jgi:hypothetical protein
MCSELCFLSHKFLITFYKCQWHFFSIILVLMLILCSEKLSSIFLVTNKQKIHKWSLQSWNKLDPSTWQKVSNCETTWSSTHQHTRICTNYFEILFFSTKQQRFWEVKAYQ